MRSTQVSSVSEENTYDPFPVFLENLRAEENEPLGYKLAKRSFDLFVAITLLIISAPLLLVIAIGVKFTSSGPILFRQERIGKGGKPFTFVKFRSMTHNADNKIHRDYMQKLINGEVEESENDGSLYKIENDPRITEFGHFLRRTSLDELPQLLNVVQGSMSLVGPRPPIAYEVNAYKSWHLHRLSVKPGITGLWQVSGRSSTTFDEMVKLDLEYIEKRSFYTDLKILFQTIPATLNTKTAA